MADFLTYPEQLETSEWKSKRESIIERDHHRCTNCGLGESRSATVDGATFNLCLNYDDKITMASVSKIFNGVSGETFKQTYCLNRVKICNDDWPINTVWRYMLAFRDGQSPIIIICQAKDKRAIMEKKDSIEYVRLELTDGNVIFLAKDSADPICLDGIPTPVLREHSLSLNVHHKYYIFQKKAWDYPDSALVTLCADCHQKVHDDQGVEIFSEQNGQLIPMHYTKCQRCNGAGWFPEYSHIQAGICFRCNGLRYEELISEKARDNKPL